MTIVRHCRHVVRRATRQRRCPTRLFLLNQRTCSWTQFRYSCGLWGSPAGCSPHTSPFIMFSFSSCPTRRRARRRIGYQASIRAGHLSHPTGLRNRSMVPVIVAFRFVRPRRSVRLIYRRSRPIALAVGSLSLPERDTLAERRNWQDHRAGCRNLGFAWQRYH